MKCQICKAYNKPPTIPDDQCMKCERWEKFKNSINAFLELVSYIIEEDDDDE